MSEIAVTVQGLGKRYRIGHQRERYGRLTEALSTAARTSVGRLRGGKSPSGEWIWALRDINLTVERGQVLGVIGRNGAGKTTLLKILSRITEPTTGQVTLAGRVGSLLEVGTGFHPELTGRENVFMSGAVLGMSRSEINRKFDQMVDFAGVEQFLDTPVKRYSSGMQVRLGFAVAAHLETEILIVDEVLAVGDAAFQRKCLSLMEGEATRGRTVLFVSHNMPAIESLCTSAVLLRGGSIEQQGPVSAVVESYLKAVSDVTAEPIQDRHDRQGDGRLRFTGITATLRTGSDSQVRVTYAANAPLRNVDVAISVFTTRGEGAAHLWTMSTGQGFGSIPASGSFVCAIPHLPLMPGAYAVNLFATVNGVISDWVIDAATLEVNDGDFFGTGKLPPTGYGSVLVPHDWSVTD